MQPDEPSLFEVLTKQVEVEDGVYGAQYENLFVIPADRGLFKVNDFLSSSGAGAFILKQRLRKINDMVDVVLIDVQPSRSQICLSAVGASDYVLIPVEANVKGVNSLVDTLDFLKEQAELEAFTGSVLGIIPFRDRWVGNTQTLEGLESLRGCSSPLAAPLGQHPAGDLGGVRFWDSCGPCMVYLLLQVIGQILIANLPRHLDNHLVTHHQIVGR